MSTDVLIVGAGPTGLVLALCLARRGVRFRIIDKTAEPGTTSRALAVHARTLEFYQMLGFGDEAAAAGYEMTTINLHADGRLAGRVRIGRAGEGQTRYPFVLVYPQDEHERLLIEKLEAFGVRVERSTTLIDFTVDSDGATANLARADGSTETLRVRHLCGCDGAHSAVRKAIDVDFPGGTYDQLFYVADVDAEGPTVDGELHACLGPENFCLVFPRKEPNHVRLVGSVPIGLIRSAESERAIPFEELRGPIAEITKATVSGVRWHSTYRVSHRVVSHFRRGRVFLLGDAAHLHSPVGGQGMNTGIGDAVNLSWKLAEVLEGSAPDALLDTYETERIAFARRLVDTTDRAFARIVDPSPLARFVRLRVAARLLPLVTRFGFVRRAVFRTVSQLGIEYRSLDWNGGAAGRIKGGDRLPWVRFGDGSSNYDALRDPRLQIHHHGPPDAGIREAGERTGLPVRVFSETEPASRAGIAPGSTFLVRPDGHVAFASASNFADGLETYLRDRGWRPTITSAPAPGS